MYDPRHYDSPPLYSPQYSISPSLYPPRSVHWPPARYVDYRYSLPDGYYTEERPQHFYRWFSPPGIVKILQGATVLMCFLIFACVASTLVWDMNGFGYKGVGGERGRVGSGPGYYGGSYGYGGSYMTPHAAKSAMITVAAVNFLVSLGFLVGSFSRSRAMRGCRFYLTVFICDIILAVLQGIIDIIFVIGVNPMSQSSQSMLYNPMLMMCQSNPASPSLSAAAGGSFPGGYPMYSQYLHHYCYMDPEESVALVLGLMVVLALSLAAYYSYKTRSKIWRHGKSNIIWDQPQRARADSPDLQHWVRLRDVNFPPTTLNTRQLKAWTLPLFLFFPLYLLLPSQRMVLIYIYQNYPAPLCSSDSDMTQSTRKLPEKRSHRAPSQEPPKNHRAPSQEPPMPPRPPAEDLVESQWETGYTTGGDTGNELDQDLSQHLFRWYPAIISDEQRRQYKREFDSDLAQYKSLCADMDDISDQMHKLSRELDILDPSSIKYQGVADEYNRLKDLKRVTDYQAKKKQCRELRQKLFHIKRLVKNYDQGMC
ncbi:hypothetical protein NQD34_013114 [Periophthalmus magnuspinnatus]|nr:hypothetical protein NQD34_013114 [Periophthalmus magnuspinnatus]